MLILLVQSSKTRGGIKSKLEVLGTAAFDLQGLDAGARPQYAALVFGDNVTSHVQGRVRDAAEAAFPAAAHLNVTSAVERLGGSLAGLLALSQGTPAGRCAFQNRYIQAVTVISFHCPTSNLLALTGVHWDTDLYRTLPAVCHPLPSFLSLSYYSLRQPSRVSYQVHLANLE